MLLNVVVFYHVRHCKNDTGSTCCCDLIAFDTNQMASEQAVQKVDDDTEDAAQGKLGKGEISWRRLRFVLTKHVVLEISSQICKKSRVCSSVKSPTCYSRKRSTHRQMFQSACRGVSQRMFTHAPQSV
jgi:hypothetical protein